MSEFLTHNLNTAKDSKGERSEQYERVRQGERSERYERVRRGERRERYERVEQGERASEGNPARLQSKTALKGVFWTK